MLNKKHNNPKVKSTEKYSEPKKQVQAIERDRQRQRVETQVTRNIYITLRKTDGQFVIIIINI